VRRELPLRRPLMAMTAGEARGHLVLGVAGSLPTRRSHLMMLPVVIGLAIAAGLALFASRVGLDRDRAFYATVLIVVAHYYLLFAAMGGTVDTLLAESAVAAVFVGVAALGFTRLPWLVASGLAAHGLFDLVHAHVIVNPGVPAWWPAFCLSFDVGAAAWLVLAPRRLQGAIQ
jgi:hypothetical protein